jgi:antirestriction protein ArdC
MQADLYQTITQQVIATVAAGAGTYHMPWHCQGSVGMPANAITGRGYRGINTLLLWAAATRAGYSSGKWATYRQWCQKGCQVRKGSKATLVLFWKPIERHDDDGEELAKRCSIARAFSVFNADQVDGHTPESCVLGTKQRIEGAETFFAAMPAAIWQGGDSAFFDPVSDTISIPSFGAFSSSEAYYGVLAHELTHWTGTKDRLNRDLSGRFGSEAYAMEELVAELGAAFVSGHLGLASTPRDDQAAYIASWLKVLRQDSRAIITAASRAQAAADYLISLARHRTANDDAATAICVGSALELAA